MSGAANKPRLEGKPARETRPAKAPPDGEKPLAAAEKPTSLPRMWDFGSENCIPCKTMMGILNPMMSEFAGRVDVRIVNVYQDQALARQCGIQIIPTQIFMDAAGKELYRHVGVYPRDSILTKFKQFGFVK